MDELINKIVKLTKENATLRLENQLLKRECQKLKEMNNYYSNKCRGKL